MLPCIPDLPFFALLILSLFLLVGAYEVLSEPESRHVYDYEGFTGLAEIQKKNKERGSGYAQKRERVRESE
jgi:flagellar biosynthesis component FlhA